MSGSEWNLTDELAYALAHALAHHYHAKGTCEQCDRGRAAVDEWLRLRDDTRRGWAAGLRAVPGYYRMQRGRGWFHVRPERTRYVLTPEGAATLARHKRRQ